MKHLTITDYGTFLGITSERLVVYHDNKVVRELPLNRLSTITVMKDGVSFSSNLILNCGLRGIKFFVFDEFARNVVCLSGGQHHAVAKIRESQFEFNKTLKRIDLSKRLIVGKIKNQKNVLNYYKKYIAKKDDPFSIKYLSQLDKSINAISGLIIQLNGTDLESRKDWMNILMGFEGAVSKIYWQTLVDSKFFPLSFEERTGRGATDVVNQMLNYGYGVLSTYVWHTVINCGLEVYSGFLHVQRPGKPSLILDLMEEYRPWVVDRAVIKLRDHINNHEAFTKKIKTILVEELQKSFSKKIQYKDKNVTLETLMQRQMYHICGEIMGNHKYKPHIFKW